MKKKFILFNLIMLFPTLVFATPKVTISTSASSIENGKSVTLNVKISDTAAWNIDMSGSGSGSCHKKEADVTSDGKNTSKTFTLECKSTSEGKITFKVVGDVTGQDDDKATKFNETKEVSVTRARSSDNTLKDLKVNNNTVSGFSSKNTSYRINNDSSSISISATANDSNAKVSGTGSKSLKYGDNTFTITVTAENGSKKNYTITVHRNDPRNTNNYLKNLCIDAGSMDFNKNTLGYSIKLEHNINEIVIDAEAEDSKAKITGTGTFKINDYILFS